MIRQVLVVILFGIMFQSNCQSNEEGDFLEYIQAEIQARTELLNNAINNHTIFSLEIPFGELYVAGEDKVMLILVRSSDDVMRPLITVNSVNQMKLAISEILDMDSYDDIEFGDLNIMRQGDTYSFDYDYDIKVKYIEEIFRSLE